MDGKDGRKAHQVALDYVERALLEGELPVGSQLPPERELAVQLGISRGAVREAIRILQAQGILESQPGPGRGTRTTAGHTKALGRLFQLHLAIASTSPGDLTETRIALERSTAALAARNWETSGLHRLEDLVQRMDQASDLETFNELDTQFHVEIAVTARSPFIGDLTSAIRQALRLPILHASRATPDWDSNQRVELVKQHHDILDAIITRDSEAASRLVEEHIRYAYEALNLQE